MSAIPPEQRLVVARARLGDEHAFQWLVHHYTSRLLWFVQTIGLSRADAEDVVQDAWLVAWSSLHRLRKVERFRSWLYGIARNKTLQRVGKPRELPTADLDPAADVPDDTFFDAFIPHLSAAMDRLSEIHREVLALRFLEGMTYEELSQTTGIGVGTIKSRLHNAKLALRRQLEMITHE